MDGVERAPESDPCLAASEGSLDSEGFSESRLSSSNNSPASSVVYYKGRIDKKWWRDFARKSLTSSSLSTLLGFDHGTP